MEGNLAGKSGTPCCNGTFTIFNLSLSFFDGITRNLLKEWFILNHDIIKSEFLIIL
jgi:hypothetical protein